jgi:hypothetical protein
MSLAGVLSATAQDDRCTSTLETVAQQVGETVVFCGTPAQVTVRGRDHEGPVFLNFGGKYPDNTFSVVIWSDVAGDQIGELEERYSDKLLLIHGVVAEHNGKPEIKLAALKDIEVEQE